MLCGREHCPDAEATHLTATIWGVFFSQHCAFVAYFQFSINISSAHNTYRLNERTVMRMGCKDVSHWNSKVVEDAVQGRTEKEIMSLSLTWKTVKGMDKKV
jgi:hypothetical protein